MTSSTKKSYKDYLEKTFIEELNYKIWTTKGSRFHASKRLMTIYNISTISNSLLTAYLIAIGLLSVYNIYSNQYIAQNVLPYIVTCLSILVLVFNLLENNKNYQLRSKEFHNCSLELSNLYNELRIFKTLKPQPTDKEIEEFARQIAINYESILQRFENHNSIDHSLFKTRHPDYFELSKFDVFRIRFQYYFETQFIYHLMITAIPVISIWIISFSE